MAKKFKIVAHIGNLLSIEETNKEKAVHKAIADFNENAKNHPEVEGRIEVYQLNEKGYYCYAEFEGASVQRVETKENPRPIGFERW
jgi:hypothetical protein